jgi:hypothetical protein
VYAQHGHELMGWKSPVVEPRSMTDELHRCPSLSEIPGQFTYLTSTTSRGQGQTCEGMSRGSLSAKQRADGQKRHRRPTSLPKIDYPELIMSEFHIINVFNAFTDICGVSDFKLF